MNSFSLGKKCRSNLEPGQRIWSHVSSSTGCHPKFRRWTTPSPTVFAIRVRIARQIAGSKTRNNNSSTTVSQRWRNAGPIAFQLQVSMLKSDKIWCAYLVVNCVSLRTFWTPLVCSVKCVHNYKVFVWITNYEMLNNLGDGTEIQFKKFDWNRSEKRERWEQEREYELMGGNRN